MKKMGKSSIKRLLCFMLSILMLASLVMPGHYHVYAEGEDEAVENVKELLAEIDSLQEMQDYRVTVTREVFKTESGGYSSGNYENRTEQHITAQNMYKEYIDDMFVKRAAAKEAYDALTDEQKAQIQADETAAANLAKLDPYDELPTYWFTQDRIIIAQTEQTAEQLQLPVPVTPVTDPDDPYIYEFVRAYELSFAFSNAGYPCTYTLIDATTSGDSWMPDSFYEYGESNYLVAYCCDANVNAHRGMRYKRMNLEDADYYSKENAAHIRTIVENSYPFVSIDEMKQYLIENGMDEDTVNSLTRSDMIASVQWAVWYYSNFEEDTEYRGTAALLEARDKRDYILLPSLHDYRNEDWTWYLIAPGDYYSASGYRYTYYEDIKERVDALTDFLLSLPGTEPEDHQIIISNVEIARTALVPGEDGTYEVEMNIFLNHGTESEEDSVTLEVMVGSEETDTWVSQETVQVDGNTIYPMKVKANNGETIRAIVDGTQKVERGVYFYQTEGGKTESQCFVNVAEGTTRVHTEEKFTFTQEADMGLSVYKTATGTGLPISEIPFSIYQIDPEDVEDISEEPTEEEVEKYAVEENLIETISTDNTGYAFLELDRGTYLVVEELNEEKVRDVSAPIYVNVPNPVEITDEDGEIVIKYEDIVPAYFENIPVGTVGVELSATKEFNDWGKADSFTFELEAVTEDAPLPGETKAVATEKEAVATFETIVFEKQGTYSYTITEVNDGIEGISYDTEPHQVTITVKRNDEGALEAEVKYDGEDSLTITNTFEPAHAAIELTKEFNDWSKADKFTFSLSAITDGAPLPQNMRVTATKDQPLASFGDMTFEKSGTYEYEIREINDGIEGISYDTAAHKVVINVDKENDTNKLTATVTYDGAESLKIINTFAPAEAELTVTKELTGREWNEDDKFSFTLEAVTEGAPLPETLKVEVTKDKKSANFGKISYEKSGTYEYVIKEEKGSLDGVTYDIESHKVNVIVEKAKEDNKLTATVAYDGSDSLKIINTFAPAEAELSVTKELTGREWNEDDRFSFTLEAVTEGAPLPETLKVEATKDKKSASFGKISYEKSGTYEYVIKEEKGSLDGVTYDIESHKVNVTVAKAKEDNKLTATVAYDESDSLKIINTFAPAEAELSVTKELTGREWNEDDRFSFTLEAVTEGAPLPETLKVEATKDKKSASFGKISYEKSGTYEYVIKEEKGSIGGISYDSAEHKVLVTVSKDEETNKLTAAVTYDGKESLTVVNPYNAEPVSVRFEVRKTIEGKPENKPVFTFVLKETTKGADYSENIKIEGEGSGSFKEITFEKTGIYHFEISEEAGKEERWKYDSKVYDITVTVTDDGSGKLQAKTDGIKNNVAEFKNTYEDVKPPKTGDSSMLLMWYGLLATSSLSAAGIMVSRRKETDEE